jgi:two-component system response regulator AtoC
VLSPTLQARLLRVLVEGEAERVGATRSAPVDVRVLLGVSPRAAAAWADGGLLPELASRLSVFPLRVPPLARTTRGRGPAGRALSAQVRAQEPPRRDEPLPEALDKLTSYAWPGNVRELENAIERAAILARGDVIQPEHLAFASPPRAPLPQPSPPPVAALEEPHAPKDLDSELDAIERRELLAAIERCAGNKAEVARSLGVRRTTLYYRLKRLGIEV